MRVGIHSSRRVAVLIVGFLAFPLEVLRSVLVGDGGNVPGQRVVFHHVLGRAGPEYLNKSLQFSIFLLPTALCSLPQCHNPRRPSAWKIGSPRPPRSVSSRSGNHLDPPGSASESSQPSQHRRLSGKISSPAD